MADKQLKKSSAVAKAERYVIRMAMGIVNEDGWAFRAEGDDHTPVVVFPGSMRRLESAIAKLKEARRGR